MALDILHKGVHPVFCYGAQYGGTLEPHYLAAVFSILTPSPLAFQLAMGVLVIGIVLTVWALARSCYGERAGLFAGLYLAAGPSFFFYKGLTSDGAYSSLVLVCGLSLWLLLAIERRLAQGSSATLHLAVLGWLLGIAWWILPISAFMAAVGVTAVVAGATRAWLAPRGVIAFLASFLIGGLPWWWYNLQNGWASLKAPELAAASVGGIGTRLASLFWDGWSILLGASSVTTGEATFPGSRLLAWAVLAALVGFGLVSLRRSAVLLAVLVAVPCLALFVARTDFAEPRYLLPAYLAIAPLAGGLIAALWERWAAGAVLATVLLLTLNLGSQIASPRLKNRLRADEKTWVESNPGEIVRRLRERAVDAVYASYWVAYRTTFLSAGEVIASPFGSGDRGLVRHLEHQAFVDRHPAPAFLLYGPDLGRFESYLSRFAIPHRRESFEGVTLFEGLPAEEVARLRACKCIPESVKAGDIEWLGVEGPQRVTAGGEALYRVAFRNLLPRPLSPNVRLSYHWRRPDGTTAVHDGPRTPISSGMVVEARVLANLPPGEYDLVFDLVDEGVSWFEWLGISPPRRRIVIGANPNP